MDTGDTRSVNILEAISDHNTYKIFKLVNSHPSMRIHIQLKAKDTFALSGGNSRREINLLIDAMIEDRAIRRIIKSVPTGVQYDILHDNSSP